MLLLVGEVSYFSDKMFPPADLQAGWNSLTLLLTVLKSIHAKHHAANRGANQHNIRNEAKTLKNNVNFLRKMLLMTSFYIHLCVLMCHHLYIYERHALSLKWILKATKSFSLSRGTMIWLSSDQSNGKVTGERHGQTSANIFH